MSYHIFNIGRPPTSDWWLQNLQRGVITAGYDAEPGDRGDVILHDMDAGDWVIAYANSHGFVGAGIVLSTDSYKLHSAIPEGSMSNHRHERGVRWSHYVLDVENAVTLSEAGRHAPRQTKEREGNAALAEKIIALLQARGAQPRDYPASDFGVAYRKAQGEVASNLPELDTEMDARVWMLRAVVMRQGQPAFRAALIQAYEGRCAVTGCSAVDVLEAAHIVPYRGEHTQRTDNGLLLRADIHTLFDLGCLWVDEGMQVRISDSLRNTEYEALEGRPIRKPRSVTDWPKPECFAHHRSILGTPAA